MPQDFRYHAFATGLAGRVTHPFDYLIDAQAPSALSPAGGYASNRVENFRLKEIISFRAAYTQVAGSYVEHNGRKSWDTIVTSTVEGLNVMGIITADLLVARLASSHGIDQVEPSIIPIGSRIEGFRIAGVPVEVDWHVDTYSKLDTYTKAREQLGREVADVKLTTLETSIVANLGMKSSFLQPVRNSVLVPQFGAIVIGQLSIDGNARQLTMLQVYPECAVGLALTAGNGQTNGTPVPPITKPPAGN